jgi:hypothetical protein
MYALLFPPPTSIPDFVAPHASVMTTDSRRDEGDRLLDRASRMQDAVGQKLHSTINRKELVLLKLSSTIVYQIAHMVSNTLKHTHAHPVFAPVTVEAMIDSVAEAFHELTGEDF